MTLRALLCYGHVASNWGDLAINAGAIALFREAGIDLEGSAVVTLRASEAFSRQAASTMKGLRPLSLQLDDVPKGGREEIALLSSYLADPRRFAHEVGMQEFDVVVLNSGEHLFETSRGENTLDLIWRILPALAAIELGKQVISLPVTLGPFRTPFGAEIEELIAFDPATSALRETESGALAQSDAVRRLRTVLDPGFFTPGLKAAEEAERGAGSIGIVMRLEDVGLRPGAQRSAFVQRKHQGSDFQESQAFSLFREVACTALLDGASTVTVIVQTRADREVSQALHRSLAAEFGDDRVILDDPARMRDFLAALRAQRILVTSRFHAVILASAQGVPAVGVYSSSHGHKMPGLFDLLRIPDGAIRLDERDPTIVAAEVREAMVGVVESIEETRTRIRSLRTLTRRWLREALEAGPRPQTALDPVRSRAQAVLVSRALDLSTDHSLRELTAAVTQLSHQVDEVRAAVADDDLPEGEPATDA
ncbi:polysaccharide pyruvyl transferase family protein [Brachybacterium sp. NBEC-018]|uniref:polysaccharide pyruvyl transferase family protein n=1 Tax=Brachybacterium sp. NBEC-018 TaxID=2996004 RepID=UPI002174FE01|nr:polysaccharide pyruvyl transferase family protein [Brachybacterium sp. NBEC-018]UVY85075.1 polysaccharide pyruvyl transferase family protein [Brachybacterium sp. NBEC-018]